MDFSERSWPYMTRESRVTVDFETRSELDLRDVGAWRYAEHPSTEILWLGYKFTSGEVKLWRPGEPFPEELKTAVAENKLFEAHNVQFERAVWIHKLLDLCELPSRWHDTLAACGHRALPLKLEEVGPVIGIDVLKDKYGKKLIQSLSKPRRPLKADKNFFADIGLEKEDWPVLWNNDPEMLQDFGDYCAQDVLAEECLSETIGGLPPRERQIWILDQIINQRGVYVDLDATDVAKRLLKKESEKLTQELIDATGGEVETGNQRDRMLAWLEKRGWPMSSLQKEAVELALEDESLPSDCRQVLELRQKLSLTSTRKLDKIAQCVSSDGRVRGLLQYAGAGRTNRWAGRLVQPQNLRRTEEDTDVLIEAILSEDTGMIELMYGSVPELVAESLRGMFIAGPGKDFIIADYTAIEARVLAWLAGEKTKLDIFRNNEPVYENTAELIFGYKVIKKENPEERHVGKICELAFGYGGALGAWRQFDSSDRHTDADVEFYKQKWRERHPNIVDFWYGLENAAISALKLGKPVSYGPVVYQAIANKAGRWLTCRLPSGRLMYYYDPKLEWGDTPVGEKLQISYQGRDNHNNGLWGRVRTYGGKLAENVTQAVARDIMAEAMLRVEPQGYPVVLTIHDEIVTEVDEGTKSVSEFENIMAQLPDWAKGCPIEADGFRAKRYKKG